MGRNDGLFAARGFGTEFSNFIVFLERQSSVLTNFYGQIGGSAESSISVDGYTGRRYPSIGEPYLGPRPDATHRYINALAQPTASSCSLWCYAHAVNCPNSNTFPLVRKLQMLESLKGVSSIRAVECRNQGNCVMVSEYGTTGYYY